MANFTSILNKGKRRFIDKCLHPRKFGRCETCSSPRLLIEYKEKDEVIQICENCYNILTRENEDDYA